jgi:hypothetical protein
MAATLFKLAIAASSTTTVSTKPAVKRYFYKLNPTDVDEGTLTIPAESFVDDAGDTVATITLATENNGYYLLFVNGVLQQETLYTVAADEVEVLDAASIPEDAIITLVVTNFDPAANTSTTVNA